MLLNDTLFLWDIGIIFSLMLKLVMISKNILNIIQINKQTKTRRKKDGKINHVNWNTRKW